MKTTKEIAKILNGCKDPIPDDVLELARVSGCLIAIENSDVNLEFYGAIDQSRENFNEVPYTDQVFLCRDKTNIFLIEVNHWETPMVLMAKKLALPIVGIENSDDGEYSISVSPTLPHEKFRVGEILKDDDGEYECVLHGAVIALQDIPEL